jgi:short-subunit dehydrogenase
MVVVITGASAGIGRELAVQLHALGAKLALGARRVDRLNELNASLGGQHLVVSCDVSKQEDCQRLIAEAHQRHGRIDTLVCNAGYGVARSVAQTSPQEMLDIFRTNVFGTTDCIRAAVPVMAAQEKRDGYRGQIMIVSSAAGRRGLPYFGAYSATKFAQLGLAEALRVELKPQRIAVTSVHPVGTDTEFFTVAERGTGLKVPTPGPGEIRQPASIVARKMIAAIRKPRTEVWPLPIARYAIILGILVPRITDKIMARYRGQLDAQQKS